MLFPVVSLRHLELWVGYYIRWNPRMRPQVCQEAGLSFIGCWLQCPSKEIVSTSQAVHLSGLHIAFILPGTCSPTLQGATGEACRAAEASGRVTARGDQSLSFIFFWTGRFPNTLHHTSADLCLTLLDPHGGHRSWILRMRRHYTVIISRTKLAPGRFWVLNCLFWWHIILVNHYQMSD